MSITLKHGERFKTERGMLSLDSSAVDPKGCGCGGEFMVATHDSGWTIEGELREDYYTWVNKFKATHPVYGKVVGDFMTKVKATSLEAFNHFYKHHQPNDWDPQDI
jgi:hypothetical protein